MEKELQHLSLSSRTRQLLVVSFMTMAVIAMAFVGLIFYFKTLHRDIFVAVESSTERVVGNLELRKTLVSLELDIRELLETALRKPQLLKDNRLSLLADFDGLIRKLAASQEEGKGLRLDVLTSYRASLNDLLQDYELINQLLASLDKYNRDFHASLISMEDNAGRLMVETAMAGKNTGGLQQVYILIPGCQEYLLSIHILVDSSVRNLQPGLLVRRDETVSQTSERWAVDRLSSLRKTLLTLTSADELISKYARYILAGLPDYQQSIEMLASALITFKNDRQRFETLRHGAMLQQEAIFSQTAGRINEIKGLVNEHDNRAVNITLWISAVVLLISVIGLLVTRKIGLQLENVAGSAVRISQKFADTNQRLEQEIQDRNQAEVALREARNELESRVRSRTTELSSANEMLQQEIEVRFQVETELAAEKESLAVTLRSIGDGVITTDTLGHVVMVNRVAEELTGWSHEEAGGRQLAEVFRVLDAETRKPVSSPIDHVMSSGAIYEMTKNMILVSRDGTERTIADSGAPILDRDSRVIGVVLVFRDITEEEKNEAELLKIRKLESVGVLAGGIAHDFNNILAAILGNINLSLMSTDPEDRRYLLLKRAEKAVMRAKDLTMQLLTFSKGGEPVKEITSIAEVIEDSSSFILRGSNIKCRYHIDSDIWPVEIDPGQISQVVQNIILNASQAMPEGGLIDISCENFLNQNMASVKAKNLVRISISDRGMGIPPDKLDRIFDPYFTTKEGGSGLGLAITHSIINKHGGHITVESREEYGTTFTVYLAAADQNKVVERPESVVLEISGGGRILVLEDDEMIREVAGEMLSLLGFEVLFALEGQEALEIYRQNFEDGSPFNLVIMDLTIPGGMGGKEAVKELLDLDPKAKVIVSSGYSNDPVVANYRDYGFVGAVKKPFRINELIVTLNRIL